MKYRILLFYKYVQIEDNEAFAAEHLAFCRSIGVKGRILIAKEGINGTVSGTFAQIEIYMDSLHRNPLFQDIVFKIDEADTPPFQKIFVRHKKELVTFRLEEDVDPNVLSGKHLSPREFHEYLQKEDVLVLDGRNDYEYDIGHFRNAIRPGVDSFRDFPDWIRANLSEYKEKTILTYCTGGVRCEKLSGFLLKEGFKDVYQLDGGIVTYGKDPEVKGDLYLGKCYVFDERISIPINQTAGDVIVGRCYHCGKPEDRYVNCAYDFCHRQHVICVKCEEKHSRFCSEECEENEISRYER